MACQSEADQRRGRRSGQQWIVLAALAVGLLLGGCFTGKRPSFVEVRNGAGTPTGDAAIDAVLTRLDAASISPPTFTAEYDIVTKFGNDTTPRAARVVVDGTRREITIGDVRYRETESGSTTCVAGACSDGMRPQAISDSARTFGFYDADAAVLLRNDATSKIGPTVARAEAVAGQNAACVDVVQAGNTATYCVLDSGVLARLDDADIAITLTAYAPTVDPSAFTPDP